MTRLRTTILSPAPRSGSSSPSGVHRPIARISAATLPPSASRFVATFGGATEVSSARILRISPSRQWAATERALAYFAEHHQHAWQLWGPRLAALMGLRGDEIAALRASDLQWTCDRWFLRVERTPRRALSGARRRCIPIPRELVDAGFVAFAQGIEGPLFPELLQSHGRRSQLPRWISGTLRFRFDHEMADVTFEQLRHLCERALRAYGADPYFLAMYLGHPPPRALQKAMSRYLAPFDPQPLLALVDRAVFPSLAEPTVAGSPAERAKRP